MRISVDIDTRDFLLIYQSFMSIWNFSEKKPIVRISSSGRGYHIISRNNNISFEESLLLRKMAGDDRRRIKFDMETNRKPKQILWIEKDGKRAKELKLPKWEMWHRKRWFLYFLWLWLKK